MERLGEVPVALVEKGKGPGSHLMSGAMMDPSAMKKLFPDLPEEEWPTYGTVREGHGLLHDARSARSRWCRRRRRSATTATTSPRSRSSAASSARRRRRRASTSCPRPPAYKLLVEDGVVRGIRSGDKGRGREGEELGNFEPGSDLIAQATVLAEGTAGPPRRRRDLALRPRLRRPAAVGARREGGLGGQAAARPRHPLDGLAAPASGRSTASSAAASSTRWARTRCRSASWPASTTATRRSRCTTRSSSSSSTRRSRRSSRAASASPGARRRSRRAATGRCPSSSGRPAWCWRATPRRW